MKTATAPEYERILGIEFSNGPVSAAVDHVISNGGCVVIPVAPALVKLSFDDDYRRVLQGADLVLADSGFLSMLWRLRTGRALRTISGIEYLRCLLDDDRFKASGEVLWLVRSEAAKHKALEFLRKIGFKATDSDIEVVAAESAADEGHRLLLLIEERKARHVVLALPRRQEQLGMYLREYLLHAPAIHCVGAALGFLTGDEKGIPESWRKYHIGWLARLASQPRMLLPRIGMALTLAGMVFRYRDELPTLRARWTER